MVAPTSERSAGSEIASEIYDPGAIIYATIEASYVDVEQQKEQFEGVVERAVATAADPTTAEAISTTAGVYRWMLFGKRGDPLPTGLIKYADEDERRIYVCEDPRLFGSIAFGNCSRILAAAGFPEILKQRTEQRRANMPAIKEAFRQGVMDSPAYQLLSAFCGEPFVEPKHLPLSPLERMRREKQIEDDVRQKFGIDSRETIPRHSLADVMLRRAFF